MNANAWTLDGTTARLEHGGVRGALDLAHCGAGLVDLMLDDTPLADVTLFELRIPQMSNEPSGPPLVDVYVRQNDLVAIYEQTKGDRLRLQTCWRAVQPPEDAAQATLLELVVSVQTDLLDSNPQTHAASIFSHCKASHFAETAAGGFEPIESVAEPRDAGFALIRPDGCERTIMQATHPSDSMGMKTASCGGDALEVRQPIFSRRLEKGVIRRARLRVAILPRAEDIHLATACYRDFAASEPMLTA